MKPLLTKILAQTPSTPLFHYTTQSGLIGIVKSGHIWATHTQYLNDRREFRHAVDLVQAEIEDLRHAVKSDLERARLDGMSEDLNATPEQVNVCVCSFSEVPDSLPQWRAYGGSSGFSMGFSGEFLRSATDREGWYLAKCVYDPVEQRAIAKALVEEGLELRIEDDSLSAPTPLYERATFRNYLFRYAPVMKDQSFAEEKEWRIISRPLSCRRDNFDFREGRSLIVPYYKFPLCKEREPLQLDRVVIGPTRDAERSKNSVETLMISQRVEFPASTNVLFNGYNVDISRVPYRDW